MKRLKQILLIKDATINKVQFDKEWFFKLDDMAFYLKEDLWEVEFIFTNANGWRSGNNKTH